jgi:hypothetical protein
VAWVSGRSGLAAGLRSPSKITSVQPVARAASAKTVMYFLEKRMMNLLQWIERTIRSVVTQKGWKNSKIN